MEKIILKAQKRKVVGRKVKSLRKQGLLPANLYGKKIKSQAIEFPLTDFNKAFEKAGETGIIELEIDSQTTPTLIRNVQLHPITDLPLHVDFYKVDLTQKVTADIPISLIGEAPAATQKIGVLINPTNEISVKALPKDLPDKIEVDVSSLDKIDAAISVKDLKIDTKKIEVLSDPNQVVAQIQPPQKEEVEVPPPTEEAAVAEGEAPPEEGAPEARPAGPEPGRGKPVEGKSKEGEEIPPKPKK